MPRLSSHVPKKQKLDETLVDDPYCEPSQWEQDNDWGPELKYFDSELAATNVVASTTTWAGGEYPPATIGTLFCPIKGTGITNRVGRTVKLRWIRVVGQIVTASQTSPSAVDQPCIVRLLLVQNTQTSGTQTQAEDVIQSGTNIVPINMFTNLSSLSQFKILKDQRFYFQNDNFTVLAGVNVYQSGLVRGFDFTWHFFPFDSSSLVNFKSDLGDYRDILDNSFAIIGICTNADLVPQISFKSRVGFHDC